MPVSKASSPERPSSQRSAIERWITIWNVIYYFALVLATTLAMFTGERRLSPGWVFGLSLALGIWYGLIIVWLVPRARGKWQWGWSLIFLAGALGLWFPLACAHPAYFIVASFFYGLMWGTLPFGLAVTGNVLLTGLIIWIQAIYQGKPIRLDPSSILIAGVAIGWSVLLALYLRSILLESTARKRLIEQLEATQNNLAKAEREAGILQERERLAQEIHDTLAQGFTSIVMQLEVADQLLAKSSKVRRHILQARDTARASLGEARRLVMALRPVPLDGASLPDALARIAERWEKETDLKIDFAVTGDPCPLHPEVEVTLLRAMQESLMNVHKHAQAGEVSVTLSYMSDQVALDVHDDGIGFNLEHPARSFDNIGEGFGLRAMRGRVAQFGGDVIIESNPRQGTTLAVQIPLNNNEQGLIGNREA